MNSDKFPTALIAEDEPLLAESLKAELHAAWPELQVLAMAGDGASALAQALTLKPDVLFFDIKMPGMSGIDAAAALADAWVTDGAGATPFPALVFVTAYDQYAIKAFETQAMDYLLKPVLPDRLRKTVLKVQRMLANQAQAAADFETTLSQLRGLLNPPAQAGATPIKLIQASVNSAQGSTIRMVPIDEVLCFEAADKYVRVLTAEREYLIRTPLKELMPQLDEQVFWQVHRGTVVRAPAIESVTRDEMGKTTLSLRGLKEKLVVSRLYGHLFKAM